MITGIVNARVEATIQLRVVGAAGSATFIEAIVDTGFSAWLSLPPAIIASLGLIWRLQGSTILANGKIDQFDIYAATVIWDGVSRNILVDAADTPPLVGMGLLAGHQLKINAIPSGTVTIEALP